MNTIRVKEEYSTLFGGIVILSFLLFFWGGVFYLIFSSQLIMVKLVNASITLLIGIAVLGVGWWLESNMSNVLPNLEE
jgi:hypothetical protein